MSAKEKIYFGLLEHMIMRPKEAAAKVDVLGTTFGNKASDLQCNCIRQEDCGLFLTLLQQDQNQAENEELNSKQKNERISEET